MLFEFYNGLTGAEFKRDEDMDLKVLSVPSLDLHALDALFSMEEIWAVVKDMPPDKAPGPDGFLDCFFQSAWPIKRKDTLLAVKSVLLPKKEGVVDVKDFQPISLAHSLGTVLQDPGITPRPSPV